MTANDQVADLHSLPGATVATQPFKHQRHSAVRPRRTSTLSADLPSSFCALSPKYEHETGSVDARVEVLDMSPLSGEMDCVTLRLACSTSSREWTCSSDVLQRSSLLTELADQAATENSRVALPCPEEVVDAWVANTVNPACHLSFLVELLKVRAPRTSSSCPTSWTSGGPAANIQ